MKKIKDLKKATGNKNPEIVFPTYNRTSIFRLILIFITFTFGFYIQSAACTISPNTGNFCVGIPYTFTISGTLPGDNIIWATSSIPNSQVTPNGSTSATIIFNSSISFYVIAFVSNAAGNTSCTTATFNVGQMPDPTITSSSQVACQGYGHSDDGQASPLIIEEPCTKVCEGSSVTYNAIGLGGSTFNWTVSGGHFFPGGATTATGSSVMVIWDNTIGVGYIQVQEISTGGCSKTIDQCIERIEKPHAEFLTGLTIGANGCYSSCLNQTIQFTDISTPNSTTFGTYVSNLT